MIASLSVIILFAKIASNITKILQLVFQSDENFIEERKKESNHKDFSL